MTGTRFRGAGTAVDVVGLTTLPDPVRGLVLDVLAPLLDGRPADPRAGVPVLSLDDRTWPTDPDEAAAVVVGLVDRHLRESTPCLAVHAASVAGPAGAVVAPARSGAGKSTTAAACLQVGLRLVSDEAACLDPDEEVVWPYPRPLGLDAASRDLLGLPTPWSGPRSGERATAPALLGASAPPGEPVPVAAVALLDRRPGSGPGLDELSPAEGLAPLLSECLNLGRGPWTAAAAWARLGRLLGAVPVVRVRYDHPRDAAAVLADLLG